MLVEPIDDPETIEAGDLHRQYLEELAAAIAKVGADQVAEETGIDVARLDSLPDTNSGFTVAEAAEILAASGADGHGESLRQEVRDHLLLRMSSAVVDVDALAAALPGEFGPRDYQQMIEGERPMPLAEYARIYLHVERQNPL